MNKIEEIKQETINQEENTSESIPEQTYKEMSPLRLVLRRFFRSKLSLVGIILIVALFLFSFLLIMLSLSSANFFIIFPFFGFCVGRF